MKKILQRLKSRAGETLAESMAAILVFTMASIIMLSMVSASADINETAKTNDQMLAEQLMIAEQIPNTPSTSNATVEFEFANVTVETVSVDLYRQNDQALYAYYSVQAPTLPEIGG